MLGKCIDLMPRRPSIFRLAALITGSILFSLSIVNLFFPVFGFSKAFPQNILVFLFAGISIYFGREWLKVRVARITVKAIVYTPPLAFLLGLIMLFVPVQPLGRFIAHRDIAAGLYKVIIPMRPWHDDVTKELKAKYGVSTQISGGCMISVLQATYDSGYQSVVLEALKDKYGRDIVKECTEKAEFKWERDFEAKNKKIR